MAVNAYAQEFTTPVAPSRMFKALILDSHNLIPMIAPQGIQSMHFEKGNGGIGSVRVTRFAGGGQFTFLKHRIDHIDMQNLTCRYTLIGGDGIYAETNSIVYEVKFESWGNGGCFVGMSNRCPKMEYFRHVADHLLVNPDVYA